MTEALVLSLNVLLFDAPVLFGAGTALGWMLAKKNFRGKEVLSLLILLPVALPPSVLGLYLLIALGQAGAASRFSLLFSFPAVLIAPLFQALPIMVQSARSGFSSVPTALEDAGRMLGDSEWKVFRRITFPLSRRFLIAGLSLSSVRALGDFGVTLMIAGNIPGKTQTLPLFIYSQMESMDFAKANIAALLLVALGVLSLWVTRKMEGTGHEILV